MTQPTTDLITVSNGQEFLRIPASDLDDARADGFYRPAERGKTIVGDGSELIEIPLADMREAQADGFRDMLGEERKAVSAAILGGVVSKSSAPASPFPAVKPAAVVPTIVKATAMPVVGAASVSAAANQFAVDESLAAELSEAEQFAAEEHRAAEQEIDEATGLNRYVLIARLWFTTRRAAILDSLQSHSVSILVHVAVLLILASFMLKTEEDPKKLLITATETAAETVEEVTLESESIEESEPTETADTSEETQEIEVEPVEAVAAVNFMEAITGAAVAPPAKPTPKAAEERKMPTGKPTFFNSKAQAINYVFVIDNSNSMTKGRFETAINELLLAVNRLSPKQRFYVIFYSDTAYPLFYPYRVPDLISATNDNKARLFQWLKTIQLCLRTCGKDAIQMALDLKPDVIFVLGDGAFTDKASQHFAKKADKSIPIHTLGMEVNQRDSKQFELLATSTGGTYRDVGVNPLGAQVARQYPRYRNNIRNGIWGIKLPLQPKPKK